jgi:ankyrin repeat protein
MQPKIKMDPWQKRMLKSVPKQDHKHMYKAFEDQSTLLHVYLRYSYPALSAVENLISMGFDVNKPDENDLTPLLIAARNGRTPYEVFELLIDSGADVNYLKYGVESVLKIYLRKQKLRPKVIKLILDHGF